MLVSSVLGTVGMGGWISVSPVVALSDDVLGGLFLLDDLARLLITISIGASLIVLWATPGSAGAVEYALLVLVFLVTAALLIATSNLLLFFIFWELTSLCAWGVSRWSTYTDDDSASAFPIQGAGALASLSMFLALVLLSVENRSLSMLGLHTEHMTYVSLLLLTALLLKTYGLVAPVWEHERDKIYSVSGGLIGSAGVIILGIYPYVRLFYYNFGGHTEWRDFTVWCALPLGLLVGMAALRQDDIHRAVSKMAYSQFCLLLAAMALSTSIGLTGCVLGLFVYGLGANAMFLCLGVIESRTGQRTLSSLSGLAASLPLTAALFVLSVVAFAGLPPFGGFAFRMLTAVDHLHGEQIWGFASVLVVSGLTLFTGLRLFSGVFLGPSMQTTQEGHWAVLLAVLAILGALAYLGLYPASASQWLEPAVAQMAG